MDKQWFDDMEAKIPRNCGVRTRFAPSPTGYMHVGGLRTALYTWLIARKTGGTFILRMEDTDQARYVEGATQIVFDSLKGAGLYYDEGPDAGGPAGPYTQSERKALYRPYAELLCEKGAAYYCFCGAKGKWTKDRDHAHDEEHGHDEYGHDDEYESTHGEYIYDDENPHGDESDYDGKSCTTDESNYQLPSDPCRDLPYEESKRRVDAGETFVVRMKAPREGATIVTDMVFGQVTTQNKSLDDMILLKRDGLPTYNFANVVDDHLMGITHVMRGSEYISSAPKYNLLYKAFGWEIPQYITVSPVMRDARHKLSKRAGDPTYEDLLNQGYLQDAIINYVALVGWSPGGEREIFTLQEMSEIFDISGISKAPAIFDITKLKYFNSEYIRALPPEKFAEIAEPYIRRAVKNEKYSAAAIASILQARCEVLSDIPDRIDFFDKLPDYDTELYINKKSKTDEATSITMLRQASVALGSLQEWTAETVHDVLIALAEALEVKNATLMWPLRIAVSGKAVTPGGAVELCVILGREETLSRIDLGITRLGG